MGLARVTVDGQFLSNEMGALGWQVKMQRWAWALL